MRAIPLSSLSPDFVRANRDKIFPDCSAAPAVSATLAKRTFAEARQLIAEKELQRDCENWLRLHGYKPRSPEFIRSGAPEKGYYIHLHETQRNPIILDILILGVDGRFIEVELKTPRGAVRESQGYIIRQMGEHSVLVRSFEEFRLAVALWERAGAIQKQEQNEGNKNE